MKKFFNVATIVSFLLCVILFLSYILPVRTYDMKYFTFGFLLMRISCLIGIISLIFAALIKKEKVKMKKAKIVFTIISSILLIVCCVIGYFGTFINCNEYLQGQPIENISDEDVHKFFPYASVGNLTIKYNTCMFSKFVLICDDDYYMQYYETASPIMNQKFSLELNPQYDRTYIGPYKLLYAKPEEIEQDSIKLILYSNKNGYEAVIKNTLSGFYLFLFNIEENKITKEDFVSQAVKQYNLIKQKTNDNTIRDYLLSND